MKKSIGILAATVFAAAALTACGGNSQQSTTAAESTAAEGAEAENTEAENTEAQAEKEEEETAAAAGELQKITVGASPAPHAEILRAAKDVLAQKGYELEILEYVDYIQPNLALESEDLDANYFQHLPYLESFNEENGTKLVSAASIHYEPFGIYAGKASSLEELADGATVAVPNDTSNEARALLLLEAQGLLKLKEGAGLNATKTDVVENPKNLEILEIEAAQIPRSLQDVDIAVINGNYAIDAGLKVADALAIEDAASIAATTYGNVVAVQEGHDQDEAVLALVEVLTSDEIKQFIEDTYAGAVVPLF